ncbi:hypothetical protein [Luteolibacter marinus]|uniref:hypothetical protein n=1 Tax=Luteolibacter marinus TaxID=2776705 RepID=UPI00186704F2|nr:hypothetical protein [Luteolibacter marinus]
MNPCISRYVRPLGAALLCLAVSSCGDDPALVSKREQQRAEIAKLEGELAILQERMEQMPRDRSDEVRELKAKAGENQKEIASLEEEIADLEQEKARIEREHEAYRRKYVAN